MTNPNQQQPDHYRLSPKQATALRQLAQQSWSIEEAQHVLQTTLGALYRRGYVAIRGSRFTITPAGKKALHEQSNAGIGRSESMFGGGFARIIGELASYHRDHAVIKRGKIIHMKVA